MRIRQRPPFDPSAEYVYKRSAKVAGREVVAGDVVDKKAVGPRRLRQMYEAASGMVGLAPGYEHAPPAAKPLAVGPTDLEHPDEARPPEKKRGVTRARARAA